MDCIHEPLIFNPEIIFEVKRSGYQGEVYSFKMTKLLNQLVHSMLFHIIQKDGELICFAGRSYVIPLFVHPTHLHYAVSFCKIEFPGNI